MKLWALTSMILSPIASSSSSKRSMSDPASAAAGSSASSPPITLSAIGCPVESRWAKSNKKQQKLWNFSNLTPGLPPHQEQSSLHQLVHNPCRKQLTSSEPSPQVQHGGLPGWKCKVYKPNCFGQIWVYENRNDVMVINHDNEFWDKTIWWSVILYLIWNMFLNIMFNKLSIKVIPERRARARAMGSMSAVTESVANSDPSQLKLPAVNLCSSND